MNRRGLLPFEQSRKDRCAFYLHGLELVGVESQGGENGGSNLGGFHRAGDRPGVKSGVRYENHHVGVGVREPTMLGLLLSARRVNYAHVRLDHDIRPYRPIGISDSCPDRDSVINWYGERPPLPTREPERAGFARAPARSCCPRPGYPFQDLRWKSETAGRSCLPGNAPLLRLGAG